MGTGLGRYDQNLCGRLDQLFQWCEERDMHISWNLWFHSYISEAVWGGGNSRYRNNPYRSVAEAVDFFKSDEAWKYEEKLHRYIIARWGYSRALFLWFVIDEINGTEGWEKGDQAAAEEWCRKVHQFFHEHDPYGRPTTGTQSGGIKRVVAGRLPDLRHRRPRDLRGAGPPDAQERQARPGRREPAAAQLPELRHADAEAVERLRQAGDDRRMRLGPHVLRAGHARVSGHVSQRPLGGPGQRAVRDAVLVGL